VKKSKSNLIRFSEKVCHSKLMSDKITYFESIARTYLMNPGRS
jgi:hypothetical protein